MCSAVFLSAASVQAVALAASAFLVPNCCSAHRIAACICACCFTVSMQQQQQQQNNELQRSP